jgi:hypothetical protein
MSYGKQAQPESIYSHVGGFDAPNFGTDHKPLVGPNSMKSVAQMTMREHAMLQFTLALVQRTGQYMPPGFGEAHYPIDKRAQEDLKLATVYTNLYLGAFEPKGNGTFGTLSMDAYGRPIQASGQHGMEFSPYASSHDLHALNMHPEYDYITQWPAQQPPSPSEGWVRNQYGATTHANVTFWMRPKLSWMRPNVLPTTIPPIHVAPTPAYNTSTLLVQYNENVRTRQIFSGDHAAVVGRLHAMQAHPDYEYVTTTGAPASGFGWASNPELTAGPGIVGWRRRRMPQHVQSAIEAMHVKYWENIEKNKTDKPAHRKLERQLHECQHHPAYQYMQTPRGTRPTEEGWVVNPDFPDRLYGDSHWMQRLPNTKAGFTRESYLKALRAVTNSGLMPTATHVGANVTPFYLTSLTLQEIPRGTGYYSYDTESTVNNGFGRVDRLPLPEEFYAHEGMYAAVKLSNVWLITNLKTEQTFYHLPTVDGNPYLWTEWLNAELYIDKDELTTAIQQLL